MSRFYRMLSALECISNILSADREETKSGYHLRWNGEKIATLKRDGSLEVYSYPHLPREARVMFDEMSMMPQESERPALPAPQKGAVDAVSQPLAWVSLRSDSGRTFGCVEATKRYGRPARLYDKPCNAGKGARNKSIRLSSGNCSVSNL
jgi:hypothetical protein